MDAVEDTLLQRTKCEKNERMSRARVYSVRNLPRGGTTIGV